MLVDCGVCERSFSISSLSLDHHSSFWAGELQRNSAVSGLGPLGEIKTILPECNYDVGDRPTYDERDGAVEGDFRDVRDARRQPNVRQGNLQREVNTVQYVSY